MINKLRNKFIALSLSSVLIVLCIIIGAINYLNYSNVKENADNILEVLSDNGGSFGVRPSAGSGGWAALPGDGDLHEPPEGLHRVDDDDHSIHDFSKHDRRDLINSPETPFESRYFTVIVDEEGKTLDSNLTMVASVDSEAAAEYAAEAMSRGAETGFISDYRYVKVDLKDVRSQAASEYGYDCSMIIFLDCARSLSNFQSFLYASLKVGALAFAGVAVFIILLSRRLVRPVAESYEKQKRFITDAGHEIKTPLTIIEADAAVIEMESGESEWLSDIKVQTRRLADLTRDLIYLSRMEETQRAQQKAVPFSFTDMARETAKSFESRAVLAGKEYTVNISDGIEMTGDDEAVKKLLTILLDNAFKYSNDNGRVSVTASKINGRQFRLTVYNTADNVSREDVPHLFERFYRGEKSRNQETGGYGIGLSIAQAIVTAHNGKVYASTSDGRSLTINVTLQTSL